MAAVLCLQFVGEVSGSISDPGMLGGTPSSASDSCSSGGCLLTPHGRSAADPLLLLLVGLALAWRVWLLAGRRG